MASATAQHNLHIPNIYGVIKRPRLLEKLQLVLEHKTTLISAPPGFGKTTVIAQFAYQLSCPVIWHSIDERERDVPTLHAHCLSALRPIVPNTEIVAHRYGYAPSELATLIADHLRDTTSGQAVYVLDDVQHLSGSSAVEEWLRTLVALLPSHWHMILISRALPNLPFAEMITRREVFAIGQDELRFTPEETSDLAWQITGSKPPDKDIQELIKRLDGWPAGTVLALQPLPIELEQAMLPGNPGPEALFNELAGTMLQAQPPGLREFLLASSTLPHLTPELCTNALGLQDSADWIEEAQSRNLFLSRVTGGLVYHTLFHNFLQHELLTQNPALFLDLHNRTARWFEQNNQVDEAFDHYIIAQKAEQAVAIAERIAQAYFTEGKIETLLLWSAQLQRMAVPAPTLLCVCAKIHTDRYDYDIANTELDAAEIGFRHMNNQAGLHDVQLQRAMINLQQGNYQEAVTQAEALLRQVQNSVKLRGQALRILGFARLRLGDVETGSQILEQALPLHRSDGDSYALTNLLLDLEIAYTRLGRFTEAAACLQEVVALRRSIGSAGALALALNNLGYYYHEHGDYLEAMSTYQEGLSVVSKAANRRAESYLLGSMGDLQRDRGAFEEALQLYNKALELLGNNEPALLNAILIGSSTLKRWQGKLPEACLLAEEALIIAQKHDMALESLIAHATIWVARARLGEANRALVQLAIIADDIHKQGAWVELIHILGLYAQTALLCGDKATAHEAMQAALQIAKDGGSTQLLAAEILHTPSLQAFTTQNHTQYTLLNQAVAHLDNASVKLPTIPALHNRVADTPYSLRVVTLGQEFIERDGEIVTSSEWRTQTAREMFLYLLFVGSDTREGICLTFWPDKSPHQIRSSFHTTLYRARHALGDNTIIFEDDLYMINPELAIWCDAHELESLVKRARLMPPRDARTEDLWLRAAALYQGDFLLSLDNDWVFARQENLRELYLDALIGLGECARVRGDLREAIHRFKQALRVDRYREDVHRLIMSCYAEKGERMQVINHLQELETMLYQELEVTPSEKTMALVETLLA